MRSRVRDAAKLCNLFFSWDRFNCPQPRGFGPPRSLWHDQIVAENLPNEVLFGTGAGVLAVSGAVSCMRPVVGECPLTDVLRTARKTGRPPLPRLLCSLVSCLRHACRAALMGAFINCCSEALLCVLRWLACALLSSGAYALTDHHRPQQLESCFKCVCACLFRYKIKINIIYVVFRAGVRERREERHHLRRAPRYVHGEWAPAGRKGRGGEDIILWRWSSSFAFVCGFVVACSPADWTALFRCFFCGRGARLLCFC